MFLDPDASQENSRGPRRLLRDTQRDTQRWSKIWSKRGQKGDPKMGKKNETDVLKKSLWPVSARTFLRPKKRLEKKQQKMNGQIWVCFLSSFGNSLGPILGPDRPKRGQDEPKRAIRSSKSQKAAFSKSLKNHQFFSVFGSRGFPREPQEAREGSQKTPKEIQRWSKTWSKSCQKVNPKMSKKNDFLS